MNPSKIQHVSLNVKNGYVWRKSYSKKVMEVALQTREESTATVMGASLTIRYMQLEVLAVPFEAMRSTLQAYRDDLVRQEKLAHLQKLTGVILSASNNPEVEQPTQLEKVAQIVIQRELDTVEGHSLEEAKREYFKASTEWKAKTIKDYSVNIDKFIVWCTANNISTVEQVKKTDIVKFKSYMDEAGLASNTKQKALTRLSSMFKFCVDVQEWIDKNPITGMMYKNVGVIAPKEEITKEQYLAVMDVKGVEQDYQTKWAMHLMYHTGMRISELCQLTKADYVEIEGIKCISINTHEEGKSTKTETSKRNIPLCDALIELGTWEEKPVMRTGVNRNMDQVSKAFSMIGLKRSTHCFRHSLSNRLRDTNCEDSTRYFILGHAQTTMTDRVYVTREPLVRMLTALNEANV
ncbi:tyrosine-type recombinase/integrase [Salmonella enterica]